MIFLGNILLILKTLVKIIQARKALVILLQNLGFVINVKNPQLAPVKEIEFLGGSDNRFKNSDTYLTTPHRRGPPLLPSPLIKKVLYFQDEGTNLTTSKEAINIGLIISG